PHTPQANFLTARWLPHEPPATRHRRFVCCPAPPCRSETRIESPAEPSLLIAWPAVFLPPTRPEVARPRKPSAPASVLTAGPGRSPHKASQCSAGNSKQCKSVVGQPRQARPPASARSLALPGTPRSFPAFPPRTPVGTTSDRTTKSAGITCVQSSQSFHSPRVHPLQIAVGLPDEMVETPNLVCESSPARSG